MKRLSIGMRLTLWYLAIFALGQILFGAGMWFILRNNLYDIVDDGVENQADDVKSLLQAQGKDASLERLRQALSEEYAVGHAGDYIQILDGNGELIFRSAFLQAHQTALLPPDQVKRPVSRTRRIEDRPFRFLFERVNIDGRVFIIEMGAPADDALDTLHQFRSYLFWFAPLLLLSAAAVGYWMSRKALSPVDELVRTARDVSGTNLKNRLQTLETGDELQRLSDTLNAMLDRIEAAFQRVTQFTADASHELRTPVSLIRTEAELALRRSRGEAEYQEALRHILAEAERTSALIEQLLSLARADSGRESVQMTPVNLSPILKSVVEGWKQVASIRGLQFSADIASQDVFVMADETWLRRLIEILLDNAFKYTPANGSVQLSLEHKNEDQNVLVTVKDSGVGIASEEHAKIFERFYRVDKARSRAEGGTGLGLSIAQWIVTQHHGTISVHSAPGQGATFRVQLPMIAAPVATIQHA
ncbi:MAG TPA: heavy metal sensor histidine kinase [Candidatus Sulfotelmatobacter sp.]|nr:heavy metal sensor histidine kinase [Candidatus Sulfotelmatobacter sp.]